MTWREYPPEFMELFQTPALATPEGMSGLTQCYDDLNNASAFIAQLMIDQINNNPAVAEAMTQALVKGGFGKMV